MRKDEYKELFDSMEIRDEVFNDLVADTLKKHKRRRKRRSGGWLHYAAAGIPVLAVLCLIIIIRMPKQGGHGAAAIPIELERITEETTTMAPTMPPTMAAEKPAPGELASELFAMSGIVPEMSDMQKTLTNISVETYFEQAEMLEILYQEIALDSDMDESDKAGAEAAIDSMRVKPAGFYYFHYTGRALQFGDMKTLLETRFEGADIYVNSVFRADADLPFTGLMEAVSSFTWEHGSVSEGVFMTAEKTFSMQCADGLDSKDVIAIENPLAGGWFYYEFSPGEQGTMTVSAGYCPYEAVQILLDGTLEHMGYTGEYFNYYDVRWGKI